MSSYNQQNFKNQWTQLWESQEGERKLSAHPERDNRAHSPERYDIEAAVGKNTWTHRKEICLLVSEHDPEGHKSGGDFSGKGHFLLLPCSIKAWPPAQTSVAPTLSTCLANTSTLPLQPGLPHSQHCRFHPTDQGGLANTHLPTCAHFRFMSSHPPAWSWWQ